MKVRVELYDDDPEEWDDVQQIERTDTSGFVILWRGPDRGEGQFEAIMYPLGRIKKVTTENTG